MKYILGVLMMAAVMPVSASMIQPGDTRATVIEQLGDPQGVLKMEASEWMLYPQGKVWLESNVVTRAELLTPEEFADKQVKDERARVAEALRQEAQRLERIEKGTELKARLLNSPDLYLKSALARLSTWQRFRRDYPEVDVSAHYLAALNEVQEEQEKEAQERRVRDLEWRVHQAEQRALEAEQAAARKRSTRYTYYDYGYPIVYSPCSTTRSHYPTRNSHPVDRDSVRSSVNQTVGGSVSVHTGHVTMKPITFGHIRFSL